MATFRAVSSNNGTVTDATAVTVTKPTGTVDDDLMILFACADDSADEAPATPFDFPAGWTTVHNTGTITGRGRIMGVAIKKAATEGASYDVTHNLTTSQEMNIVILSYSGVHTTTPQDQTAPAAVFAEDTTTPDPPSITTQTSNAMVVCGCFTTGTVGTAYDPPTGYTERADVDFDHTGLAVAEKLVAAADEENPGTFTHTSGQTTDDAGAWTIALRAASSIAPKVHHRKLLGMQ